MTLTSSEIAPFYISTFEWNAALDLASRQQDDVSLYGWDRSALEADFKEVVFGVDDQLLRIIGQLKDSFSFGWGQWMRAEDVQTLSAALQQAAQAERENAPDFLPQLVGFLNVCVQRHQGIKLEQ